MIELIKCTDKDAWNNFVNDNEGHPLQLWGWGQVKEAHGWSADRVFAYNDEQVIGGAQILTRPLPRPAKGFSYIPRGPVSTTEITEDILNEFARFSRDHHKSMALSIEPEWQTAKIPTGFKKSKHTILPAETVVLDLNLTDNELLGRMAKKTRQYIRKSAGGVKITQVKNSLQLDDCLKIYNETSNRAGFDIHSLDYYRDVFNLMGEYSPIFVACVDNKPVAFLWLAISAHTAFELYGGMNDIGQDLRANYALKWHAIRTMKQWGIKRYDFGGLIGDGVSNFKRGWSDEDTKYIGTIDKPLSSVYGLWTKALPFGKKVSRKMNKLRK